ncbi:MAG: nodulation protein NfeD [Candidatus Hydrothermales bacterium]
MFSLLIFSLIYVVKYEGVINPPGAEFVIKTIEKAEREKVDLFILQLDTPGGLDESMRVIVKKFFESSVPICVYVFPPGARATSAGAFITVAAHIAAMSPGTNIGAAHPVAIQSQVDSVMIKKALNDAIAYIKSIGSKRKRNVDILENMVKKSLSVTSEEALKKKVIDVVAISIDSLIEKVNGFEVEIKGEMRKIEIMERKIKKIEMGLRERILMIISNPTVAYILLILGFYGLFFEITHPGAIFPGVIGAICLILAFYSFQTLPVNYAGVLLILLSMILFLLEIKVQSHGILGIGGVLSLLLGSLLLFQTDVPFLRISNFAIITVIVTTLLFFFFVILKALQAQRKTPVSGKEGMIGERGKSKEDISKGKIGLVFIHGEIWKAIAEEDVFKDEEVIVTGFDGLKLKVRPINKSEG